MMTVSDLIARLEDCDPDATVLLAHQPSWPLQFHIAGVASSEDLSTEQGHDDHDCDDCAAATGDPVVYLVDGDHPDHPYAPKTAWEVAS